MQAFTLGVHNLPAAEITLVKALIRIYSMNASFHWRFSETGPFDVVLVDTTCVAGHAPSSLAPTVLKITHADAGKDADSLARPIRAEQLRAWLVCKQQHLRTLLQSASESRHPDADIDGPRFKLKRWPSAAVLNNDPQRIRLATLMSRRVMGISELSSVSRLPPAQCLTFVEQLRQAGLIEVQTLALPPQSAMTTPQATPTRRATPAPTVSMTRGLIAGIRRSLGL